MVRFRAEGPLSYHEQVKNATSSGVPLPYPIHLWPPAPSAKLSGLLERLLSDNPC